MKWWAIPLAAMVAVAAVPASVATVAEKSAGVGAYSGVPMPEEAKAKAVAKGFSEKTHVPASLAGGPHALNAGLGIDAEPIADEQQAVAIYLNFPADDQPPTSVAYDHMTVGLLDDLLFGDSYDPYQMDQFKQYASLNGVSAPTDRTLKNYYEEVSYGRVEVSGEVVSVDMPGYSTYCIGSTYGTEQNDYADYTMSKIFEDAVLAADAQVDFSRYAVDGVVPNIFLIHQGTGAEFSTDPTVIWSHSWDYQSAYYYNRYALTGREDENDLPDGLEVDGVLVNHYSIEPEVGGDMTGYYGAVEGPFPAYVGVYAHEFGHVLGLPDQYDYGYDSEGTGAYTLMASGSWTRYPNAFQYAGNSPVYLDAWSQTYLGFAEPQVLTSGTQSFTLKSAANGGGIVKIVVPGSGGNEYFLIENRQQIGFDSSLSRYGTGVHGLAIFHIDENVLSRNFDRPNEMANTWQSRKQSVKADPDTGETHYGISLVQADNRWDLEKNRNVADAGDLYKSAKTAFTSTSTPNSGSYYVSGVENGALNKTGICVKNIVENKDGSVTFTAGFEK